MHKDLEIAKMIVWLTKHGLAVRISIKGTVDIFPL